MIKLEIDHDRNQKTLYDKAARAAAQMVKLEINTPTAHMAEQMKKHIRKISRMFMNEVKQFYIIDLEYLCLLDLVNKAFDNPRIYNMKPFAVNFIIESNLVGQLLHKNSEFYKTKTDPTQFTISHSINGYFTAAMPLKAYINAYVNTTEKSTNYSKELCRIVLIEEQMRFIYEYAISQNISL